MDNLRRAELLGFGGGVRIRAGAIVLHRREPIGENSFIGLYCYVNGDVRIGRNVLIGPYCSLPAGNHKFDPATQSFATKRDAAKPIVIGDGSWLASGCTVTGGVTVGRAISFARTPSSRTIRRIMRSWPARRPPDRGDRPGERRVPLLEVKRALPRGCFPAGGRREGGVVKFIGRHTGNTVFPSPEPGRRSV